MTKTTGPPPGAILFEILLLGVFVVGIRASYHHWRRGPDLPNSARYGAVAAGLCSAAVGIWTVAFVNFSGNGPALWIGWAMFVLAAAFGAAGRAFVLANHGASDTRLAAGLDGVGYAVVGVVALASSAAGLVHCRWQAGRHRRRGNDGGL